MAQLILVTGGARSGKSSFALKYCEDISEKRCFIATCPVVDQEMNERILAHRQERVGRGWETVEEETALADTLTRFAEYEIILVDCLTLWVNNLMYHAEKNNSNFGETEIRDATIQLINTIKERQGTVCLVTNEVGSGIVPESTLGRKYRDLVGSCNRTLAEVADEVILVSCGIPLPLKRLNVLLENR